PSPVAGPALVAMLADYSVAARFESDLETALTAIEDGGFDPILVDRTFGLEATVMIAAKGLAAGRRVITLVTPAERHELGRLAPSGAAGYLIKPVRAASLIAQIAGAPRPVPANDDLEHPAKQPLAGLSVLLAEDNEINALVARTVLGKLGAEVALA